jgi:hypothetical protein
VRLATALVAWFIVLAPAAVAQVPPACPPDKTMSVVITTQERGQDAPLVATHEALLIADVADRVSPVSEPPDRIVVTPQPGVEVLKRSSDGSGVILFAPNATSLMVAVSWRQTVDPGNPDEDTKCTGSATLTVPVLSARPARGVRQPGSRREFVTFAVAPAVKRPNLEPLVVTIRSTGHVRFPRRSERLRRWVVPMRTGEQVRYGKRLPNLAYATFKQKCRSWWFVCGPVNSQVASLNIDSRGRPDLSGSNAILRVLAFSQPSRWAARYGIVVDAFPGAGRNRPFGFDVQARQSGRLLARVRRAGRCTDTPLNGGFVHKCTIARSTTLLR